MRALSLIVVALCALCLPIASAQTNTTYTYDALGRLTRVDRPNAAVTYTFDAADNRSNVAAFNPFANSWEAEALWHVVGFADGDGWAANTTTAPGYMLYGPYTTAAATGNRVAAYRMMIDNPSGAQSDVIALIDVYDATAGQVIASQNLLRSRWRLPFQYETIELPFVKDASMAGHQLEFRIVHFALAYVRVDKVGFR